jgi:hypothetical protein
LRFDARFPSCAENTHRNRYALHLHFGDLW